MAKTTKTSSKSGGSQKSRSLVYEESYFKNRNDMLQSSLDSVYQRIDAEGLAYEARLKATKDITRALDKELQRLRKMRDDLDVRQLDKAAAAQQWSAGQRNAAQRTEFLVTASNSRFLADKAFDRGMYGSGSSAKGAGIPGLDETSENEANRSYTSYPDNPNAGLTDYRGKISGTGEFAKSAQQVDLATAYAVDTYVTNKLTELDRGQGDPDQVAVYQQFAGDAKAQRGIAVQAVLDSITDPAIVGSATRGYQISEELAKKKGAGVSDEELGKMVATGRIPVESVGPPNYDAIKAGLDTRIAKLEGDIKGITPQAPVPLSERNIIEEQRDEYFRTFYPSATPAYQTNRLMQSILSGNLDPQSEMIIMDILSAERKAGRMPAEGPLGPEIEDGGRIRGFSGKQGVRMPGDIIYGEGSPFVPEESPLSDKALKILSNKGANQFFGEGLSDAQIQKRADDLFPLGLGLTKVTKEDGKVLYTVVPYNRLGQFKPEDVVMPAQPEPDMLTGREQTLAYAPEEDMRIAQENVRMAEGEPFNPAKYDAQILALTGDLDRIATNLGFLKETAVSGTPEYDESRRLESEYAEKDGLLNDLLMKRGNMQAKVDGAGIEPRRLQPVTGDRAEVRRIQPTTALQARRKAPMDYDQSEMIPLNFGGGPVEITEDTLDLGGGPVSDEPSLDLDSDAGFEALIQQRGIKALDQKGPNTKVTYEDLNPKEIEAAEETRRKESERAKPTPEQIDAKVKFNAAEKVQSIYGTPEFNKLLNTELGRAVSDLYSVNKAKGDETGGEVLSYIATEFPRAEDQSKATQILMGLSYADKTKRLLKA